MDNTLSEYLALPYSTLLTVAGKQQWVAQVLELQGCMTFGETQEEVLESIEKAKRYWITRCLIAGVDIPEPQPILA